VSGWSHTRFMDESSWTIARPQYSDVRNEDLDSVLLVLTVQPYGGKQLHRSFFRSVDIHLGLSFMALCQHMSGLLAEVADLSRFLRTGSILFRSVSHSKP